MQAGSTAFRWESRRCPIVGSRNTRRNQTWGPGKILVERARRKATQKHGANAQLVDLLDEFLISNTSAQRLLKIDEALDRFHREEPVAAQVVELRVFARQPIEEIAKRLNLSGATVYRHWADARAWLRLKTRDETG